MNIESSFDYLLKIIIIGDSAVGKSNFLFRFVDNKFARVYQTTVGIDTKSKICTLPKLKKNVKLQIWDTAGQERYMSLNKIFFQKVQGIILMYDITKIETFENLPKWIKLINETTYKVPVILVGNKVDNEEERIVREEEGENFAKDNGYLFYESSALNGKNVNNVLYDLSEKIISSFENSFSLTLSESDFLDMKDIQKKKKKDTREERCC